MKTHMMLQRSDEWHKMRLGKFTGTSLGILANGRTDTIKKLVYETASEIITGKTGSTFYINEAMQKGIDLEPDARFAFEAKTGLEVREVGFCELDQYTGVSPDGLIGDDEGIEIKCNCDYIHLQAINEGCNKYNWQIQSCLYVTGRKLWYLVLYNPNFPPDQMLYIQKVYPDEEAFLKIEKGLEKGIETLKKIIKG